MKIVSQLIKTNILNCRCLLTVRIYLFKTWTFNIPKTKYWAIWCIRFFLLYFMFFINTLYQTTFPPFNVLPNFMRLYTVLQINLFTFLINKVVCEGQNHELFWIVRIVLALTLKIKNKLPHPKIYLKVKWYEVSAIWLF